MTASILDDELWKRAQTRREADVVKGESVEHQMLVPLVLSLARLAAQRDAHAVRTIESEMEARP